LIAGVINAGSYEDRIMASSAPKKWGQRLMTIIRSNLYRQKKFIGRFFGKFAVK